MSDLGNKTIFANNLQYFMRIKGVERQDVCTALGFKYSTFSEWCNANKYPRIDKIEALAKYFEIEKSDLIEKRKLNPRSSGVKIPVLGFVRAGIPIEAVEEILDFEEISAEMSAKGEYFALSVKGDSMEPRIKSGDVVIIEKRETVENGDVAVVLINGNDATIKRFYRTESGIKLIANNPIYDPIYFSPSEAERLPVRIIGKVVELRAKF